MIGLEVFEQRLGFVKREDVAALRIGIEAIRELCFDSGGFVRERQWLPPFRVNVEQTLAVLAGLFFDASKCETFRLRFDSADSFAIDEQQVVDFIAILEKRFAN